MWRAALALRGGAHTGAPPGSAPHAPQPSYNDVRGAAATRRARELLTCLDLGGRERNDPVGLSGAEQPRVAIARALAYHPAVLLADEPTAALDSARGPRRRGPARRDGLHRLNPFRRARLSLVRRPLRTRSL